MNPNQRYPIGTVFKAIRETGFEGFGKSVILPGDRIEITEHEGGKGYKIIKNDTDASERHFPRRFFENYCELIKEGKR